MDSKEIGYWSDGLGHFWDDPNIRAQEILAGIVPMWSATFEAEACLAYLKAGHTSNPQLGSAYNRITGKKLGHCDRLSPDERWRYPDMFWDYIENQSYKPIQEFIEDAVAWKKAQDLEARQVYLEDIANGKV